MDAAGNVKGGLADHRGRKVVLPPGVDDPGVVVGNLMLEALETYGGGVPVDADGHPLELEDIRVRGRLVPVGDGRYMIELDEPEASAGEAEGTVIGGAGGDELRELAGALKTAGLDIGLPVDGITGNIEGLDEAAPGSLDEVQVAGLGKLLARLGLRSGATASGREIRRAIDRLIRGQRRSVDAADDPLTDLAESATRDAAARRIIDALEGEVPEEVPGDDGSRDESGTGQVQTELPPGPTPRGTGRFSNMPSAEQLRALPKDDFHFVKGLDGGRFLAGPDGSPNLIQLPKIEGQESLGVRLHRRDIKKVANKLHNAEARALGFRDGLEMMLDSLDNWTHIGRGHSGRLVLIKPIPQIVVFQGTPRIDMNSVVITELEKLPNEKFWRIPSAGVRRNEQIEDEMELIYERK